MNSPKLVTYSTNRVEFLAFRIYQSTIQKAGFSKISEKQAKILCKSADLHTVYKKALSYRKLKHRGKHGPLIPYIQEHLNLSLLIFDIANVPRNKRLEIIKKLVLENDNMLQNEKLIKCQSKFISNLGKHGDLYDNRYFDFIRKVDILFTIQKGIIKRSANSDSEYQNNIKELACLYSASIKKAIQSTKKPSHC